MQYKIIIIILFTFINVEVEDNHFVLNYRRTVTLKPKKIYFILYIIIYHFYIVQY